MPNIIEQVAICDEYIENEDDVNFLINKIGGVPVCKQNFKNFILLFVNYLSFF